MPMPSPLKGAPDKVRCGYGPYTAYVDSVHDGDTVSVVLDVGFDHYPCVYIRLNDVRAPELSDPGGEETRDFLDDLLPYGTCVIVKTDKGPRMGRQKMSFVRYVGTLRDEDGVDIGTEVSGFVKEHGYGGGR